MPVVTLLQTHLGNAVSDGSQLLILLETLHREERDCQPNSIILREDDRPLPAHHEVGVNPTVVQHVTYQSVDGPLTAVGESRDFQGTPIVPLPVVGCAG